MPQAETLEQLYQQFTQVDDLVLEFITNLEPDLWLRMPSEGVTHITWQVGHMVVTNYGLGLSYARGAKREDVKLMPGTYRDWFGRGSVPSPDPAANPTSEELVQSYRNVSNQLRQEIPSYDLASLDVPLEKPHPMFKTPLEALRFLPPHMSMHLGQANLLRRLAGKPARR
ncbi:MAG: DinB family protein [Pirellulaceae bacterium]